MIKKRVLSFLLAFTLFLGSYRGYVAIFEKGAEEPKQVFPCRVDTLPEADQKMLDERIRIKDEEELNRLLEDYLS